MTTFSEAFAKAQGAMRAAEKNSKNPHFKSTYADLASVIDAVREPLAAAGIARVQVTEAREIGLCLVTRLVFQDVVHVESVLPLPSTPDMQKLGAAITYARRFGLLTVCGIAADDDDDDGNTAARAPLPPMEQNNDLALSAERLSKEIAAATTRETLERLAGELTKAGFGKDATGLAATFRARLGAIYSKRLAEVTRESNTK